MTDRLDAAIQRVVDNGNCSGCGACAMLSERVTMKLSADGFTRPFVAKTDRSASFKQSHRAPLGDDTKVIDSFKTVCPGRKVEMPPLEGRAVHPIFGPYVKVFQGFATDPSVRHAGSSGGVLTALSAFILEKSGGRGALVSRGQSANPLRTEALILSDPRQVLGTSGSRYAPVAVVSEYDKVPSNGVVVGKPCEISAAFEFSQLEHGRSSGMPILLSFFCAGTPSQHGTDGLVEYFGLGGSAITEVRYRGNGWPGDFTMSSEGEAPKTMTYNESWGFHLGRNIQWRCKICVDGTGAHADVSVGDFWEADENGFPSFDDAAGNSVVIARTHRGAELLEDAVHSGVLQLTGVDLDDVARIQPLQVERRRTLVARLIGRLLAGKRIPKYVGFSLLGAARNAEPSQTVRGVLGTARRSFRRA
jgi:coenzyme F420 hydrogenase subunit beta